MSKSATPTKITIKEIKAAKNLTASQRFVLVEIHSLVARGKDFYAWNTHLAEKTGFKRSTVANALTFFYEKGVLRSKCERNDGKTAKITKRSISINYDRLINFLEVTSKPQARIRQPHHEPSKEKSVLIIKQFDDIDFIAPAKTIKNQWADYMVCWLDQKTERANAVPKEKKAVLGMLNDAWMNLQHNIDGGTQYSEVDLIKDRRAETAIKYGIKGMQKGIWKDSWEDYVPVDDWNLTFCFMRNIFPKWPDILSVAMSVKPEDYNPKLHCVQDVCFVYYDCYEELRYADIEKIEEIIKPVNKETPGTEIENKLKELVNLFPVIYPIASTEYDKKIKRKIIREFKYNGWDVLTSYQSELQEEDDSEEAQEGEAAKYEIITQEEIEKRGLNLERIAKNMELLGYL